MTTDGKVSHQYGQVNRRIYRTLSHEYFYHHGSDDLAAHNLLIAAEKQSFAGDENVG